MYKDKDKQRAANKAASQRRRDKAKGMTQQSMTITDEAPNVTPDTVIEKAAARITDPLTKEQRPANLPPDDELFAGLPLALQIYATGELGGNDYKQLIHHLKTTPIEQLQTEGRPFIPCWRWDMEQTSRKGFND